MTKVISVRMPLDILVGVYDYLRMQGFRTEGVSYSAAVQNFCRGIVIGAIDRGKIEDHSTENLEAVLATLRGDQKPPIEMEELPFRLPTEEDEITLDDVNIPDIVDKMLEKQGNLNALIEKGSPDETPIPAEDDTEPPWKGIKQLKWDEIPLKEVPWQLPEEPTLADKLALCVTLAQVTRYLWSSSTTQTIFNHLREKYQQWLMTHPNWRG
jgi:hypothetical protein